MRRFLLKMFLFALVVLVAVACVYGNALRLHPFSKTYEAAYEDKTSRLAAYRGPRLVVMGGSSVVFGIDAELVGKQCGLEGMNMGVHIGFGLVLVLAQVEAQLREGDVVLLAPEYSLFTTCYRPDPELLSVLLEHDPSLLLRLPAKEAKSVLDRGALTRVGRIVRSPGRVSSINVSDPAIYNRHVFNAHGDLISHLGKKGDGPAGAAFRYQPGSGEEAIEHLNRFHARCAQKGVRVYLSHPPFYRRLFNASLPGIRALEADLKRGLTIPYLDAPEDTVFEAGDFFDTAYHLNPDARTKRSLQLAQRLSARLKEDAKSADAAR